MKKLLKIILQGLLKIMLFLYHFLFPNTNKKEKMIEVKKKNTQKQEGIDKPTLSENNSENSGDSKNIFKEHLKFTISPKEIDEEFNKIIEKTFAIKIIFLSEIQKTELREYKKKTLIKVEEELLHNKINKKEDIKKDLENTINKDLQELNKIIKTKETISSKTIEEQERTTSNLNSTTIPLDEQPSIYLKKEEEEENVQIKLPEKQEEPIFPFSNKEQNKENLQAKVTTLLAKETKCSIPPNNVNSLKSSQISENKPLPISSNKETEQKQNIETVLKSTKKSLEQKKEVLPETKKNNPVIEINFKELERKTEAIKTIAVTECNKEELVDKEYEEIEILVEKKIEEVEALLLKTITPEQKEKLTNELKKLQDIKEQVALHKEQDLEDYRLSLEETISFTEIQLITKQLQEFYDKNEFEKKKKLFTETERKTKEEIDKIKQTLIKEQIKKTVHKLEIPLFLSFPFIKNKHFRRLVGGLFIFRSFQFIKNVVFGSKILEENIDLSAIKRGRDALAENIILIEKNKISFEELKQTIFTQYPALLNDEEFLQNVEKLEEKLQKNYKDLVKQEKIVNKYFDKSKVLVRKRKL